MKKAVLLLLFVLLLATVGIFAKSGVNKPATRYKPNFNYSTTVMLDITADKDSEGQVYSYMSRELRALGDVKVVNDYNDAKWVLYILEAQHEDRYADFYVTSITLIKPFRLHEYITKDYIPEKTYRMVEDLTVSLSLSTFKGCFYRAMINMEQLCKDNIMHFDSKYLRPERESWDSLVKIVHERLRQKKHKESTKLDFKPETKETTQSDK